MTANYNPKSHNADEFMNHNEIMATLDYAQEHKNDIELCYSILEDCKKFTNPSALKKLANSHACTLDHRSASVLLACEDTGVNRAIKELAKEIKLAYYGRRIVLFAPLYLSNYCVNGCLYCPYHAKSKEITRKKLTQEEIAREVCALQDLGHKRLAIEAGEDPVNNPIEYILDSIKTIYSAKHKNGSIRRVNVNIAATTHEEYAMLKAANIGTYILFQETYNKQSYETLHPTGPKSNYAWHTEAMDRAMQAGIDDVGLGVLFGLESYFYEFAGLIMHAEHLEAAFGCGPHTISVPRVKPACGINPNEFDGGVPDEIFEKIIALIRIAVPYTGMIISTREDEAMRAKALNLGISQISGGSKTSVGGYARTARKENTEQFSVSDGRNLDEVVSWLFDLGHIPSFCTACYRAGRTGERFMQFCKNGEILNYCHPNALVTLAEYLMDYANDTTKQKGFKLIDCLLNEISDAKRAQQCRRAINNVVNNGERDIRF